MLLSLFVIHLCALAAPGPDFFFVSRTALSGRLRHLVESASGVAIGILIWATLTLLGLNLLFERFPYAKLVIMTAGAIYLLKLAVDIYRSARQPLNELSASGEQLQNVLLKGVLTNLANPKAVIYFTSIFSSIPGIENSKGLLAQILILIVVESLVWFFLIGKLFTLASIRRYYSQNRYWVDYFSAAVFALFAVFILVDVTQMVSDCLEFR
ncbi:MAG: hypothetical protein EOM46_30115, partial [Gammaproteobacteria bacterium]|nr:hypothetical protein [Gammaproteobacteria bacterium]